MPLKPSQLDTCLATLHNGDAIVANSQFTDTGFCLLNRRGFVAITGKDAEKFLQGQLSCDLKQIVPEHSSLGAHCTAKGRAIASFRLVKQTSEHYLFSLPADNCDNLLKSLGKYIVFSKATLTPVSDQFIAIGLSGGGAATWLKTTIPVETKTHASFSNDSGTAVCINAEQQRFELWLNHTQFDALWPQMNVQLTPMHPNMWHLQDIKQGLVEINAALSDSLIPQMFNLDQHDGISFSKGCYTGQEIIARLKYLGKQKRVLTRFSSDHTLPVVGSDLVDINAKSVGVIVALTEVDGIYHGLAVAGENAINNPNVSPTLSLVG